MNFSVTCVKKCVCDRNCSVSGNKTSYLYYLWGEAQATVSCAGCVWSSFHKLRNSDSINQVWTAFMTVLKAPEPCQVESQLALQLLMDWVLKKMLKNKLKLMLLSNPAVVKWYHSPSERRVPFATWQDM